MVFKFSFLSTWAFICQLMYTTYVVHLTTSTGTELNILVFVYIIAGAYTVLLKFSFLSYVHTYTCIKSYTQCWCGPHWYIHHCWQCSGAGREGWNGGYCWDSQQDTTTEDEYGSNCGKCVCVCVCVCVCACVCVCVCVCACSHVSVCTNCIKWRDIVLLRARYLAQPHETA